MEVVFNSLKNKRNKKNHGIYLSRAEDFDMNSAQYALDDREDYGEERWIATGFLDARLFVLTFILTERGIRAISLRKAETHEEINYAEG